MEQWLKNAKEAAKWQAECFVKDMEEIACEDNLDPQWFITEVIKNINSIMRKKE